MQYLEAKNKSFTVTLCFKCERPIYAEDEDDSYGKKIKEIPHSKLAVAYMRSGDQEWKDGEYAFSGELCNECYGEIITMVKKAEKIFKELKKIEKKGRRANGFTEEDSKKRNSKKQGVFQRLLVGAS